ncbi:glycoside hydrolase family 5 protein, partial [Saccharata proteae CBS 121410]
VDQWTFDSQNSASAIEDHWASFCNESMIETLANYGINALRIPIGYWAYDNSDTPYHSGADAYLERAIGWAKQNDMKVIIDLHGVPGQQNTAEGCGHVANVEWGSSAVNYNKTSDILCQIAEKYGTYESADTVIAISLVNEPSNDYPNTLDATQDWTKSAFAEVRDAAENKNLRIASHDQWVTPKWWIQVNADLNTTAPNGAFLMDIHQYQLFNTSDRAENQDAHVAEVCRWVDEQVVLAKDNNLPLYVGEFGGNTLICVNPDGSTFGDPDGKGHACTQDGCQCEADGGLDLSDWNDPIVQQVRRYVEVQMQYFEKYSLGWFFWNFRGPGAWGFIGGVEKGFIPQPLDNYTYGDQCSSSGL